VTPAIVTEPGMLGGTPHLAGHRLGAVMIARYYLALGFDETQLTYDLSQDEVLVACWWVARYGPRSWRARWREWLLEADAAMWRSRGWSAVPLPPREDAL
jgi:uncharacterized protein (DUF433 family)